MGFKIINYCYFRELLLAMSAHPRRLVEIIYFLFIWGFEKIEDNVIMFYLQLDFSGILILSHSHYSYTILKQCFINRGRKLKQKLRWYNAEMVSKAEMVPVDAHKIINVSYNNKKKQMVVKAEVAESNLHSVCYCLLMSSRATTVKQAVFKLTQAGHVMCDFPARK